MNSTREPGDTTSSDGVITPAAEIVIWLGLSEGDGGRVPALRHRTGRSRGTPGKAAVRVTIRTLEPEPAVIDTARFVTLTLSLLSLSMSFRPCV